MQIPTSDHSIAHDAIVVLIAAGVGLVSKIVWDWLKIRRNGNGNSGALPASHWEHQFDELAQRNEKSFENALKILVIPVMTRTNEILEEMKENDKKLTEAIITMRLRDEAREFVGRAKGATG